MRRWLLILLAAIAIGLCWQNYKLNRRVHNLEQAVITLQLFALKQAHDSRKIMESVDALYVPPIQYVEVEP